jgi:hypothetical protein
MYLPLCKEIVGPNELVRTAFAIRLLAFVARVVDWHVLELELHGLVAYFLEGRPWI